MSLFDELKSFTGGPTVSETWNRPNSTKEIDAMFEEGSGVHIIYKHSFACSVCIFTMNSLERELDAISGFGTPHFIDVREQRSLSDRVAERSGVRHESPQVVIIRDGQAFWTASHGEVRSDSVLNALKEI